MKKEPQPAPLSAVETNCLIAAAQQGNLGARNALVEANMRLVQKRAALAARRCGKPGIANDLIQTAIAGATDNDGLIHAIAKFDLKRGLRFSTYAVRWIDNAIQNAIAAQGTVRMGRNSHGEARLRMVVAELTAEDGIPPTPREVRARCVFLGFEAPSDAAIERALMMVFEEPLPAEVEAHDAAAYRGQGYRGSQDLRALTAEPDPERALQEREEARLLLAGIEELSHNEFLILRDSFGLFGAAPRKLVDIAAELGIARQRASDLKIGALKKLRAHIARGNGESLRDPVELTRAEAAPAPRRDRAA